MNSCYGTLGSYFKEKTYVELPWQRRQHTLLFDEMERLSQVNWPDVAMHAALSHTDVEDLFSKKNTNSPIWNFSLKQENIVITLLDDNIVIKKIWISSEPNKQRQATKSWANISVRFLDCCHWKPSGLILLTGFLYLCPSWYLSLIPLVSVSFSPVKLFSCLLPSTLDHMPPFTHFIRPSNG